MKTRYQHRLNGDFSSLPVGKIVCVGRNYADHAKELNNAIPAEPILFMKAPNALVSLEEPFAVPMGRGSCHFETELAILVGERLTSASVSEAKKAIVGIGIALDLTLRDVQDKLKGMGLPWEKAKAFDGSCPLSEFVSYSGDLQNIDLKLERNGRVVQDGNTRDMIFPTLELLSEISEHFTLVPGDVVLTGTPAGVGPLSPGDTLTVLLGDALKVNTSVIY
ncbi:fumarylacetoacetate hydrolase family protein [Puniceicoccaceae bacterium K14]|nr:fumarylacetoacetate hydrolase family protein [Puniceicoccaceae bacterium K14]